MSNIYIIGNGFDLSHGLHTSYEDLRRILKRMPNPYGVEKLDDFISCFGVDWNNFEESLSEIDLQGIMDEYLTFPDYQSDYERDRTSCIFEMNSFCVFFYERIKKAMNLMIENAEKELVNTEPKNNLFNDIGAIISFNYTSTIETLYNINSVYHIHGFFNINDELLYGYKTPITRSHSELQLQDSDYYIDQQLSRIKELYQDFRKDFQTEQLKQYLNDKTGIDTVIVYGHSMGGIDSEYMEILENMVKPTSWIMFYHDSLEEIQWKCNCYSFCHKIQYQYW